MRIAVDIDGVLADQVGAVLEVIKENMARSTVKASVDPNCSLDLRREDL